MSEVLHVMQLIETIVFIAVVFLLITQFISLCCELWNHIISHRTVAQLEQNQWVTEVPAEKQQAAKDVLEKNAIDSLKKEMTQIQNKNAENQSEQVKNEDTAIHELYSEVKPNQKTYLVFYLEFNNFMSEHVSIVLSMMVVGMLTASTFVFTVACFFCFLFCSLIFDFLHMEERFKRGYKSGFTPGRIVKIFSGLFIILLFINYWVVNEY